MAELYNIEYIGDGVYVQFDGYGYELRANDHRFPTDKIYLEPEVFESLLRFEKQCENKTTETSD